MNCLERYYGSAHRTYSNEINIGYGSCESPSIHHQASQIPLKCSDILMFAHANRSISVNFRFVNALTPSPTSIPLCYRQASPASTYETKSESIIYPDEYPSLDQCSPFSIQGRVPVITLNPLSLVHQQLLVVLFRLYCFIGLNLIRLLTEIPSIKLASSIVARDYPLCNSHINVVINNKPMK